MEERKLPKLLVLSDQQADSFYPQTSLQNHMDYWDLYLQNHPELKIQSTSKVGVALEVAYHNRAIFMDISAKEADHFKSGLLILPNLPSLKLQQDIALLEDILQDFSFLEIVYNIRQNNQGWTYQSKISCSNIPSFIGEFLEDWSTVNPSVLKMKK